MISCAPSPDMHRDPVTPSSPAQPAPPRAHAVILLCFFLSGATGLVYQVLWLRMLGLVFGHTVHAITTVLTAFMVGLTLGSFLFARRVGRLGHPIRTYGWLELGIGVSCALVPAMLSVAHMYVGLPGPLGASAQTLGFVRFLMVFALLAIPTTLMGATLPVLSQALASHETGVGRVVGVLYAVNTFGAVVGVLLAGYLLLPALGNRTTVAIAATANVAVGILAMIYGWSYHRDAATDRGAAITSDARRTDRRAWLTVAALAVSGAVSMVYEVAWTRALSLVIGSSTYAFSAMLVAFLVGIAGGSALYSWLRGHRRASAADFATIQLGIGAAVALTLLAFERMPELFLEAFRWSHSPGVVQLVQLVVSAGVLLLSTLLIGATFPCAVAASASGAREIGRDVGHVYAMNTLGAIGGTVIAGFVLIPLVGVHASIKAGALVNLFLALALFAVRGSGTVRRSLGMGLAIAVAAGIVVLPPWDQRVMSSGPAIYAKSYVEAARRSRMTDVLRRSQLVFYRDGTSATVSVHRTGPHTFLRVNGKTDAGTDQDMPTQLMCGHLPLLLHRDPRSVLIIGLGSGITVGAAARHPVERIQVVEIEPAVVEASRFFVAEHGDVLKDPRVKTLIGDGRNFLQMTGERYDVIVSEPSNPWIGGLASLFSVEFFRLARQGLRPDGIMLQWVQGYSLLPEDFQMVVRTFRTAFPATTIWNTTGGDFLLVGSAGPQPLDLVRLKDRFQARRLDRDTARIGLRSWPGLLGYFVLDERDTARLSAGSALNTDDRLPLEFSAPRALYLDTTNANWRLARSFNVAPLPDVTADSRPLLEQGSVRHAIGMAYLNRAWPEQALLHLQRALQLEPDHVPSMLPAAKIELRLGRPAEALRLARTLVDHEPMNAEAHFVAGMSADALGNPGPAVALLERAFALNPQDGEIRATLDRVRAKASR
jgi:spermidine synthase